MDTKNRVAVVGLDLGRTGDDALVEGLKLLATGALAKLHLLFVYDPDARADATEGRFESAERALANAAARVAQHVQLMCRVHGFEIDARAIVPHTRIGEPAATLLQMCVDYDADLVIVGTHGRTGLDRVFSGSVAETVARRASCPVIVARRKDYGDLPRTALPDLPYAPGEEPQRADVASGATVQPSTTIDAWHPSDNGPTGFRIV